MTQEDYYLVYQQEGLFNEINDLNYKLKERMNGIVQNNMVITGEEILTYNEETSLLLVKLDNLRHSVIMTLQGSKVDKSTADTIDQELQSNRGVSETASKIIEDKV